MVSLFLTKEGLTLAPTNLQRFITEELKCTCECNIIWCDTHKSYSHTEQYESGVLLRLVVTFLGLLPGDLPPTVVWVQRNDEGQRTQQQE